MKKILYLMLIVLGITIIVFSNIQYKLISNDFIRNEIYFINGYLDTVLIVLGWVGICLLIIGAVGLIKFLKKFNSMKP